MADEITIVVRADDQFSGVLGNFGNIMTGIKSTIDLAGQAIHAFAGFAQEGLDSISFYERLELSLTSLTAAQMVQNDVATSVSAAWDVASLKAQDLLDWMQQLAINSPFTLEGVAIAFRTAEAYGFTGEQAKILLQDLIDFAAATGQNEDSMNRIALALGQIQAKGHVAGQEILQLVNAGLPAIQILADGFGVSTEKMQQMVSDGVVPADRAIQIFTEYMETNFAGAAEKQATSWAGLMGTFSDIKQMGLREFFGGLFEVIQPLAVEFSTWLQGPGLDKLAEWGTMLGNFTQTVVNQIPAVVAKLEELKSAFDVGGISAVLSTLFQDLGNILSNVDWVGITNGLDTSLAEAIGSYDWKASGEAFGKSLLGLSNYGIQSQKSVAAPAIAEGLKDWLISAFDILEVAGTDAVRNFFNNWESSWSNAIRDTFNNIEYTLTNAIRDLFNLGDRVQVSTASWNELAKSIGDGIIQGWKDAFALVKSIFAYSIQDLIDDVKRLLGISSPSSVFRQIGVEIILGLIEGISSMVDAVIGVIKNILSKLIEPLKPILDFLGIDFSSILGTTSTGTVGGGTPTGHTTTDGTGTLTGTGTSTVTLNFYGPVYMSGVPAEGTYDCPPNIIIQSGSNQLVPSGY